MSEPGIIFCELLPETKKRINDFARAILSEAPRIGKHGLNEKDFWSSGIFRSAIERLRGIQAASMTQKRAFMDEVLGCLKSSGSIRSWDFVGVRERHDYVVEMADGRTSIIETKGCLDGNNTNIFERPPEADEFVIWSLCQNPGSDPRHNAWSGIHTRLGAEIIHRKQRVDGLVIWDMVCGTIGRPCPKLVANPKRATKLGSGRVVPPPCVYLFPRTLPDPRNNPGPKCWKLADIHILDALWRRFNGNERDVVEVKIEARMRGADLERRTRLSREGTEFMSSEWTTLRRARR
jgi:hypothetical protein